MPLNGSFGHKPMVGFAGVFISLQGKQTKTKHSPLARLPFQDIRCDHPSLRFRSVAPPRFLHPLTELPPPQRKCKYHSEVHSTVKGQHPSEFFFNCQLFWALVPELCGELCGTILSDTKLLNFLLDKNQSFTWVLISYTLKTSQLLLISNANNFANKCKYLQDIKSRIFTFYGHKSLLRIKMQAFKAMLQAAFQ